MLVRQQLLKIRVLAWRTRKHERHVRELKRCCHAAPVIRRGCSGMYVPGQGETFSNVNRSVDAILLRIRESAE